MPYRFSPVGWPLSVTVVSVSIFLSGSQFESGAHFVCPLLAGIVTHCDVVVSQRRISMCCSTFVPRASNRIVTSDPLASTKGCASCCLTGSGL